MPPEGYTSSRRLCDDDGMISQVRVDGEETLTYLGQHNRLAALTGHAPISTPFDCTGSAHLAGEHIYCTSPAHDRKPREHVVSVGTAGFDPSRLTPWPHGTTTAGSD